MLPCDKKGVSCNPPFAEKACCVGGESGTRAASRGCLGGCLAYLLTQKHY